MWPPRSRLSGPPAHDAAPGPRPASRQRSANNVALQCPGAPGIFPTSASEPARANPEPAPLSKCSAHQGRRLPSRAPAMRTVRVSVDSGWSRAVPLRPPKNGPRFIAHGAWCCLSTATCKNLGSVSERESWPIMEPAHHPSQITFVLENLPRQREMMRDRYFHENRTAIVTKFAAAPCRSNLLCTSWLHASATRAAHRSRVDSPVVVTRSEPGSSLYPS